MRAPKALTNLCMCANLSAGQCDKYHNLVQCVGIGRKSPSFNITIIFIGTTNEKKDQSCYVHCKSLTRDDYVDLTWTTFAEFPGKLNPFLLPMYYTPL